MFRRERRREQELNRELDTVRTRPTDAGPGERANCGEQASKAQERSTKEESKAIQRQKWAQPGRTEPKDGKEKRRERTETNKEGKEARRAQKAREQEEGSNNASFECFEKGSLEKRPPRTGESEENRMAQPGPQLKEIQTPR